MDLSAGPRHPRGVCPQVGRGAPAWQDVRGLPHQGPSVLQVHASGRQVKIPKGA